MTIECQLVNDRGVRFVGFKIIFISFSFLNCIEVSPDTLKWWHLLGSVLNFWDS
jgi:hypothetical protein